MARRYRVLTDRVYGRNKGDEFDGPVHPALVGVHVEDITEPLKAKCPACQNEPDATAKAKKATYESQAELAEHYQAEHPALAAPEEGDLEHGQTRT